MTHDLNPPLLGQSSPPSVGGACKRGGGWWHGLGNSWAVWARNRRDAGRRVGRPGVGAFAYAACDIARGCSCGGVLRSGCLRGRIDDVRPNHRTDPRRRA